MSGLDPISATIPAIRVFRGDHVTVRQFTSRTDPAQWPYDIVDGIMPANERLITDSGKPTLAVQWRRTDIPTQDIERTYGAVKQPPGYAARRKSHRP